MALRRPCSAGPPTPLLEPAAAPPDQAGLPQLAVRLFLSSGEFCRRADADTRGALLERALGRRELQLQGPPPCCASGLASASAFRQAGPQLVGPIRAMV